MTLAFLSRPLAPVLAAAALLAACSADEPSPAEQEAAARVPGAPPGAASDLRGRRAAVSDVRQSDDLIEFAYAYPRDAAAIPLLAEWLDNDRATRRDALLAAAGRERAAAEKAGFPYRRHSHLQKWQTVTNTPRFLSLSAEIDTYKGGAHGMTSFATALWDRNRARQLQPLDLFASGDAFDAAIREPFCAGIKRAKAAKGIVAEEAPDSPFARCPPASAQTVWLGSSDGRYLDRMTIAIAPYEIGPFAEGSYKINVPVTKAVADVVKDEFARDFLPIN